MVGWLRTNLFSSVPNTILTLFAAYLLYLAVPPIVSWAFINADWVGDSREACDSGGACWVFVNVRFNQFMYGLYPESEYWRINLAGVLIIQATFSYFRVFLFVKVSESALADLRQSTYNHLIKLPISFFDKRRVGELNSRISSDISLSAA